MILRFVFAIVVSLLSVAAYGQSAQVPFGGLKHDATEAIEVTADSLTVSQGDGTAEFIGSVNAGQGSLKITADRLLVEYATKGDTTTGEIEKMTAFGNVTLTNGEEAAEGQNAVYWVDTGKIKMTGDVLLTQGPNAIAGNVLNIDLNTGDARFEGRIRTVLQPSGN